MKPIFADFSAITSCEGKDGGCYCSFWHQRAGFKVWEEQCRDHPERNKATVLERVRAGFHVGVLAYEQGQCMGWVSVAPLPEFYWTWKRVAALGLEAEKVAGMVCFTAARIGDSRRRGFQEQALAMLKAYGRQQGWVALEAYPFDASAVEKHGPDVFWPGLTAGFENAGFSRVGPHWLSQPGWERSIYRLPLA